MKKIVRKCENIMNMNKLKKTESNNKIPYYLLSLEQQEDEFVSSQEGKELIKNCEEIIVDKLKKQS